MKPNIKKMELEMNRLGWNKARLAKEMGVTRQSVYYYFSEDFSQKTDPRLGTITKMGKALGIDPKDLLT